MNGKKAKIQNKIVQFDNVTVAYGNTIALEEVTFDIEEGEFLGIIGPNGSGKTTLLKTILGLVKPLTGMVKVFGRKIEENINGMRTKIGYVPQKEYIDPTTPFLVRDVVLMGRYAKIGLFRMPSKRDREKVIEVMKQVGMENMVDVPVGHLSGGQLQRVLIARALISEPEILLLDEPTSGLDVQSQVSIIGLIDRLHSEMGLTVLFVTHDINTIMRHCSRVMYLNKRVYALGRAKEVLNEELLREIYKTEVKILFHEDMPYVAVSDYHV